jgi:hypothetical protein
MTNDQGAKSQSSSNDQFPMTKKGADRQIALPLLLGFGHWNLGFDWDLASWDLVIRAFRSHPTKPILVSSPPWLI